MKLRRIMATVVVLGGVISATSIIPVPIERLTSESSHVVEATAVSASSQWNPQHSLIYTYTRFAVSRALKGQAPATIVVRQIGGSAEGYTQKVAGVRHWQTGERTVLFLRPSQTADGTFEVTGLMQGNFLIKTSASGETLVSNGVTGVTAQDARSQQTGTYQGSFMRLEDLESRVQKAVHP